ncbi:MAG TPA: hypothetical protein VFI06_05895 [Chitinophagaceae bacterium]|nr:hypothetical protein [Chitinophagaceae bacterium]
MKNSVAIPTLVICILCSCSNISKEKNKAVNNVTVDSSTRQETVAERALRTRDRLKISGDFDGDGIIDTVYESYISSLTDKETLKTLDSSDGERNMELIIANKPESRIYSTINPADTFILTKDHQQSGIFGFENLGDLNDDKGDELGYIIDWADYSNINRYHILTFSKDKKWKELFDFQINEAASFEQESLFKNNSLIQKQKDGSIKYKFYGDTGYIEEGRMSFKQEP